MGEDFFEPSMQVAYVMAVLKATQLDTLPLKYEYVGLRVFSERTPTAHDGMIYTSLCKAYGKTYGEAIDAAKRIAASHWPRLATEEAYAW